MRRYQYCLVNRGTRVWTTCRGLLHGAERPGLEPATSLTSDALTTTPPPHDTPDPTQKNILSQLAVFSKLSSVTVTSFIVADIRHCHTGRKMTCSGNSQCVITLQHSSYLVISLNSSTPPATKARFPLPELTGRVDGPSYVIRYVVVRTYDTLVRRCTSN